MQARTINIGQMSIREHLRLIETRHTLVRRQDSPTFGRPVKIQHGKRRRRRPAVTCERQPAVARKLARVQIVPSRVASATYDVSSEA